MEDLDLPIVFREYQLTTDIPFRGVRTTKAKIEPKKIEFPEFGKSKGEISSPTKLRNSRSRIDSQVFGKKNQNKLSETLGKIPEGQSSKYIKKIVNAPSIGEILEHEEKGTTF